MRICQKCKKRKHIDSFHKDASKKDGHGYICKNCRKQYRKKIYSENKELELSARREYYKINKEKIRAYRHVYNRLNKDKLLLKLYIYRNTLKISKIESGLMLLKQAIKEAKKNG